MSRFHAVWMFLGAMSALNAQTGGRAVGTPQPRSEQDERDIRAGLAEGFEKSWNSHQPATAVSPDKCIDDAVFINVTGGWVKGREVLAELLTRFHAPGGRFHEESRRHEVEEVRFIRPDIAFAVVKTFDKKRAGAPVTGEETRGLIILSKEDGHWKLNAGANTRIQAAPVGRP